jgi:hypothetical protein
MHVPVALSSLLLRRTASLLTGLVLATALGGFSHAAAHTYEDTADGFRAAATTNQVPPSTSASNEKVNGNSGAIPSPAVIRACTVSITRLAGCLNTAAFAVCGGTLTRFLGCAGKAYTAYQWTVKIKKFQSSAACPPMLGNLTDYLCTSRVPPAPRSVVVTVDNGGFPLLARIGASTFFAASLQYPSGARVAVVCVTPNGQTMTKDGRYDAYWSRLTNGLFLPRIGLSDPYRQTVPIC